MNTEKSSYFELWEEHINQLSNMSWNLTNGDDRDEVRRLQNRLMKILEKAEKQNVNKGGC